MERIAPMRKALETVIDSTNVLKISKASVYITYYLKLHYQFELIKNKRNLK